MFEVPQLIPCGQCVEDENMKEINRSFASNYLYRIFMYEKGKSREHDLSVRGFQDFLYKKGVQYSIRSLYDYAEGKLPFPAALIPHLIEFSRDRKLIALFLPVIKSVIGELTSQYEDEEEKLKGKMTEVKKAKEDLNIEI